MSRPRRGPSDPRVTSTSTSTTTGACPFGRLGLGTRSPTRAGGGARAHFRTAFEAPFRNPQIPPVRRHTLRFGLRKDIRYEGELGLDHVYGLLKGERCSFVYPGRPRVCHWTPLVFFRYPSPIQRILLVQLFPKPWAPDPCLQL
jgi:hypothetical protein